MISGARVAVTGSCNWSVPSLYKGGEGGPQFGQAVGEVEAVGLVEAGESGAGSGHRPNIHPPVSVLLNPEPGLVGFVVDHNCLIVLGVPR